MTQNRVFVTGLGAVSSIGHELDAITESIVRLRHGIEVYAPFQTAVESPVSLAGTIKEMDTSAGDPEDWVFPERYRLPRNDLKGMSPHVFYAYRATVDALADAGLSREEISNTETGLYSGSSGSTSTMYRQMKRMHERGVSRCSPLGIIRAVVGAVNFNLCTLFKIRGSSCGFASACSSSAHAIGLAFDEIALGRQERMIVLGAEDGDLDSVLPFAGMRALATTKDPDRASLPFDRRRTGFVGTGGAGVLILEREDVARRRGARTYAELLGWGQTTDGYHPSSPHPRGEGLARAMEMALKRAGVPGDAVDYINAHATGTLTGDVAEVHAIRAVLGERPRAAVSSTKGLTGHALSAAGALEALFTCLALHRGFTPGNANLKEIDPVCEGLHLPTETRQEQPRVALSNSAGFGGANVSLVFRACRDE
jgi:3-oxoacyl-[acyl-carrier-protein] synthase I